MIVCRLELWPGGDAARARDLGTIEIANIGGTAARGDYAVRLLKCAEYARRSRVGTPWRRGAVRGFPRLRLGPYDLLLRALAAVIGDRNPAAAEAAALRLRMLDIEEEANG